MVQQLGTVLLTQYSGSSSRIATATNRAEQSTSSNTGWKWAQRDDAEWMLNDFINNIYGETVFGLRKEELSQDEMK